MKVSIKDFAVTMDIKTKGIELDVHDNNDNHLGDLVVTKRASLGAKGRPPQRTARRSSGGTSLT